MKKFIFMGLLAVGISVFLSACKNIQPRWSEKRNIYKKDQQNPKTDYRIISKNNDL